MRCSKRKTWGVVWAAAAMAGPFGAAMAQAPAPGAAGSGMLGTSNTSVQTSLSESLEYNTNPLMVPTGAKAIYGIVSSPQVVVTSDTPAEHLDLTALLNSNQFNLANYGSEDGHATLNMSGKSAHWTGTFGASFDYDTTRTSEETTSGLAVAGIRHAAANFAPALTYNASQIDLLTLAGSYGETRYSDTTIYTNYMQGAFTPSYTHVLDQTNMVALTAVAQRFETRTGQGVQFNDFGGNVGWKSILSELFSLKGDIGAVRRISNYDALPAQLQPRTGVAVWEITYDLAATYRGLQDNVALSVSRAPTPLSARTEADMTRISLTEAHNATQKIELDLTGSYQFSSYSGTEGGSAYIQKNYVSIAPKVQYHMTDIVSLALSYNYHRQQAETLGVNAQVYDPASSNAVMFVITLSPYRKDW